MVPNPPLPPETTRRTPRHATAVNCIRHRHAAIPFHPVSCSSARPRVRPGACQAPPQLRASPLPQTTASASSISISTASSPPLSSNCIRSTAASPSASAAPWPTPAPLIAASYEAKALGIHTLTKVGEAKRICPDIILVKRLRTPTYAEYSHRIAAAVERICPVAHTPFDRRDGVSARRARTGPTRRPDASLSTSSRPSVTMSAKRCAVPSAWPLTATSPRSPSGHAETRRPDRPAALAAAPCHRSPRSFAICLASALRPRSACTPRASTPWSSCSRLTATACIACGTPSGAIVSIHWLRGHVTGDDGAPVPSELQKSLGHSHVLGP